MSSTKDVCVIGAQGTLGSTVVGQFESAGWRVHPAGRRADRRERFRSLDLDRPETVSAAVRDVDLVASAVPYPGLTAERVVLEQGGLLVNCSDLPAQSAATVAATAGEPKGTVLINAGLAPGVGNLVAADLLAEHPDADCVEVAVTVYLGETTGKAAGEFAHRALTARRRHRVTKLPMPMPFGELKFIQVAEDEDVGMGAVAEHRRNEFYLGFADPPINQAIRAINRMRLMSALPKVAFLIGRGGAVEEASRHPCAIWIGVRRGDKRLGASILECEGDYRTTAAIARVFGEALLDRPMRPGCFNPEDLFRLSDLLPALGEVGLRVTTV
jgi:hypothetical protein